MQNRAVPWYTNPEWWQVGLTVVGAGVATAAFLSDREAVRKTQRADLLVVSLGFEETITLEARIVMTLRNFGPTRANQVVSDVWAGPRESTRREDHVQPLFAIAAGAEFKLPFPPLVDVFDGNRDCLRAIRAREVDLVVAGTVRYLDVFDRRHQLGVAAVFDPDVKRFRMIDGL